MKFHEKMSPELVREIPGKNGDLRMFELPKVCGEGEFQGHAAKKNRIWEWQELKAAAQALW